MVHSETGLAAILTHMRKERGPDNGEALGDDDISALARDVWTWVASLPEVERSARLREGPRGTTLLEVAGPDVPFLVNSVTGECRSQNAEVRVLFHPIVARDDEAAARGDRWSVIQLHLAPLSVAQQARLLEGINQTVTDVQATVSDYHGLLGRMRDERTRLAGVAHLGEYDRAEALAFLDWLVTDHFVFMGARTYRFEIDEQGQFVREEPMVVDGTNLGILRDDNRNVLSRGDEPTMLTGAVGKFLHEPEPLIIAKSSMMSRVHRRVHSDYIGVKHYDEQGRVIGETRFLGLFTADAYNATARSVPLIRRRVERLVAMTGGRVGGHTSSALENILETWPRDELLQSDAETLAPMVNGVLHLMGRPRARLFVRRDRFDRFVSAIVYVPRDAYNSSLRRRLVDLLCGAFDASLLRYDPRFDADSLVRLHIQLALESGEAEPNLDTLQRQVVELAARWEDAFRAALSGVEMAEQSRDGADLFVDGFSVAYREMFSADEALRDVTEFAELSAAVPVRMRAFRVAGDGDEMVRVKVYSRGAPIAISRSVPVFENMGMFVETETAYQVRPAAKPREDAPEHYWIQDLTMRHESAGKIDLETFGTDFQDAFSAVWMGEAESDAFNRLIFETGATWREADLLRALCAYRRQTGLDPAMASQVRALVAHAGITRDILAMFRTLFDPEGDQGVATREVAAKRVLERINIQLAGVRSLEDDRVLRRITNLVLAIKRTNFYCPHASVLAFKVASGELEAMPRPVPYREIFVAGPIVEGVHLRFGPVARGGLRWSDRPDDFRTEVLGLVKAQQVKNAVIVPVGSKGGFYPKQLPAGGDREQVREAGVLAYRAFIGAMLELTDNLIDGELHHPKDMIIRDEADPYLVVAADKGTATFSDIANEISTGCGFWLGDAFASGGSAGYDHKVMGITARGGWEAVKRHFLETDKDIQTTPFTVIGVGDMSGDVFGNGMLLSKQIRLVAAFNHMHVFVDPNPGDPETMWAERDRLFKLGRSGWNDYDTELISAGGGVFERSAKSIVLSGEVKALTGLTGEEATPDELIHALLKAQVELLWFGGIGTYVRGNGETDREVGDRANDGIRIDAVSLRAAVVGEGANLGITQAARIEFAARGGRINTDAIDNSAGVDSSDHEVNIKILLSEALQRGELSGEERNPLLASMTDDVAQHVLAHNIAQTGALTMAEATAREDHAALERLMVWLEQRGVLDREVEGLPSSAEMTQREKSGSSLTRPEISVLLAWSKITLFDDIVASDLPDEAFFGPVLEGYFPLALGKFSDAMQAHRLKREIVATVLANRLLDSGGPVFLLRLRETSGAGNAACVRAFEIARAAFDMSTQHAQIIDGANQLPANARTQLELALIEQVGDVAAHVLRARPTGEMGAISSAYRDGFLGLGACVLGLASSHDLLRMERRIKRFVKTGASEALAKHTAQASLVSDRVALIDISAETDRSLAETLGVFNELGSALKIDRLRARAHDALGKMPQWDRMATLGQLSGLLEGQAGATRAVLANGGDVGGFLKERSARIETMTQTLRAMELHRDWSFAKLALATDAVRAVLS